MRNGHVRVTAKEKWKVSVKASSCDMSATPETVSMSQLDMAKESAPAPNCP